MIPDQIPIGRFSAITRLSIKALRYYDEKGLLVPEEKDPVTGFRYYTTPQIERGVNIMTLVSLGFSLDDVRQLLAAMETGDTAEFEKIRACQLARTTREIERLKNTVSLLARCRTDELIPLTLTEPVIKTIEPVRVVSKSGKGPIAEIIHRLSREILDAIQSPENQRNLVKITGPFMTIYPTDDHDVNNILIERAIPISGRIFVSDPDMEIKFLKETRVISLVHKGMYESLHVAYARLLARAAEQGIEPAAPFREIYLNNPVETSPENYMTEIQETIR
ncbi:MAG: GyrI-like domain-containing protein [Methanoregula sp.]|nr:GyrI-like domain-containing protein [Methanoregula sp.]